MAKKLLKVSYLSAHHRSSPCRNINWPASQDLLQPFLWRCRWEFLRQTWVYFGCFSVCIYSVFIMWFCLWQKQWNWIKLIHRWASNNLPQFPHCNWEMCAETKSEARAQFHLATSYMSRLHRAECHLLTVLGRKHGLKKPNYVLNIVPLERPEHWGPSFLWLCSSLSLLNLDFWLFKIHFSFSFSTPLFIDRYAWKHKRTDSYGLGRPVFTE